MDIYDPAQGRSLQTLSRRRLLQGAIAGAVALSALGERTAWAGRSAEAIISSVAYQATIQCASIGVLDAHVFATLAAIGAQIIPSVDEHGAPEPGATEACTVGFLEVNAAGNAGLNGLLTNGVTALDGFTQSQYGATFVNLSFADQTNVLQAIANLPIQDFLNIFFSTCRSLHKTAWLINWPEAFVRDQTGQPFFSDPDRLISDPDTPGTGTGWEVIGYHVIDWQVEQLLWAWQAGLTVTGFDRGWPVFSSKSLTSKQRQTARDQLYALSDQGLA